MKWFNSFKNKGLAILVSICLFASFNAFSQENLEANGAHEATPNHESVKESHGEKFEPGKFIIHHISDAHDWHLFQVGNFHATIPLPVILYNQNKGLVVCMSSEFKKAEGQEHNAHAERMYNGFILDANNLIKAEDGSTVYDFSFTKNVTSIFISIFLLCIIFISLSRRYTKNPNSAPRGLQSWVEPIILLVRDDVIKAGLGEKKYEKFAPYLMTLFFFIFFNNLMGLIPIFPGGANVTGNIAVTMVLALITFIITTVKGNKNYWVHIFNTPGVPWWLKLPIPLMPVVELMGLFIKPFVLMVRLFANITAGHIIALGFLSLIFIFGEIQPAIGYGVSIVSVVMNVFMALIELLVAFIQAYVFTLLSSIYIGMAIEEHHTEEHH